MSDVRQETLTIVPLEQPREGVRLIGEVDLATVARFRAALAGLSHERQVTLDFSELTFIDSTGLHAILDYAHSFDGRGPLILLSPSPTVRRIFEIVGLPEDSAVEIRGDGE